MQIDILYGNEGNIDDAETQKLWVKYGFSDILIETVDIISDEKVINGILSSDIWSNENIILRKGKINKVEKLKNEDFVEHLFEIMIDFFDKKENINIKLKGLGDIDTISKYKGQELSAIIERQQDNNNLRYCCFLLTNI